MFHAALRRIASHMCSRPTPSTPCRKGFLFSLGLNLSLYGLLLLACTSSAFAGQVALAWDPASGSNLAGYMLYYGSSPGHYSVGVDVGNYTSAALSGLQEGETYYFVATAYDTLGNESSFSNEVIHTIPMANDALPTVALMSPLDGATVSRKSTVTMSAIAEDDVGVTTLEFYVNGSLICSNSTTSNTCAWNVPAAAGKRYQLQAKAYDTAGNVGVSSIIRVTAQ